MNTVLRVSFPMIESAVTLIDISRLCAEHARSSERWRALVGTATLAPAGSPIPSAIACRRRPGRRRCRGRVTLWRQEVPARIAWSCPSCADSGTLVGWRGSAWDFERLRGSLAALDEGELRAVLLEPQQYDLLLRELPRARARHAFALAARAQAAGIQLVAPLDAVEDLAAWLAEEVERAHGPRRRRLDRLCDRIERATSAPRTAVS